ncbi:hypothetical protein [Mucilaginibacter polytrichastri]|uniref:Uncharacterized protein n=1 Tax=Mucilaginibacter polytrichastri TaxID=1302689 RepID=A0A1Q6A4N0_9SPHI|nr:hypothetical protein [Mucilaginibacter polytrichastri]OKS88974.1 hypothetical protein RG47T_4452 [Mucilaginibacter polytrichastri]SFS94992.1 hypothetical protein SAMN04487890_10714 [Mucilaginibacter polytrichastri]
MSQGKTPPIIGAKIKLSQAEKMISDYRANCDDSHIHHLTISADHLRKIIDQPDCHYVKFHIALADPTVKAQGLPVGHTLVAVGVNSASNTIKAGEEDSEVYEDFSSCPPNCNPNPPHDNIV